MKINRIHAHNFRNIVDATLDTEGAKFVVLRGGNRQGKTSMGEATSLALTDTVWGLDKRGAGFAKKIRRGEREAKIEVDLQGANRTIRRTATLSVGATGRTQSSEDLNDAGWHPKKFDDLLTLKKAALGVAINTRSFMSMVHSRDEDSQKSLLASLVLPARYEFPKETVADVDGLLGVGVVNFDGEPFAAIEQAYKKLHKEREDANRKVRDFVVPPALARPQGVDSESLKTRLATLREDRTKQASERDAASKKSNEETLKAERAKAKIDTLEAMLKASKEALRALEGDILPEPSAIQAVADQKTERERLLGEQQRISGKKEAAKKEVDRLIEISKIGYASCPTCDQDIDQFKLGELVTLAMAARTQVTEEYDDVSLKLKSFASAEDIKNASDKLDKHKKALENKAEAVAKIEENEKALQYAKEGSGTEGGGLFEPTTFDTAISQTDKDIETILQQIQPVLAAEEREKDIATKKEQLKRLEDKAEKLDRLVKFFDKDGIKAKLIATHIGGFEQKVNEVLASWNYSCSLSIEPFKFEVTDYRNVTTPLIDLSGAEEIMFYAAFQCAVSRTAGIGFVVIDRVDTLLPDLRPKLFQKLYEMVSENVLDQVILLVADSSEKIPKLENSAFFIVEEGNIRRLE